MTTENDTAPAVRTPTRTSRIKPPTRAATAAAANTAASKSETVIKLLLRTKGATPLERIAATDWQPHSVRAFLSGLRKKGRTIVREARKGGEFAYRITIAPAPSTAQPPEMPQATNTAGATSNDPAQV